MTQNHRNNDPPTSALAGRAAESSGLARMQRSRCMEAVIATPGLTAREIEDRTGIKAHKRLPELREAGLIANGPSRRCRVTGRRAMTWLPLTQTTPNTGEHGCH